MIKKERKEMIMLFIMMMLLAFGSGSHSDDVKNLRLDSLYLCVNLLSFFFLLVPSRSLAKLGLNIWV